MNIIIIHTQTTSSCEMSLPTLLTLVALSSHNIADMISSRRGVDGSTCSQPWKHMCLLEYSTENIDQTMYVSQCIATLQ